MGVGSTSMPTGFVKHLGPQTQSNGANGYTKSETFFFIKNFLVLYAVVMQRTVGLYGVF